MFLLGQWKNYDDLEGCLTLEELYLTYETLLENRLNEMEFHAKINGAEMKNRVESRDTEDSGLAQRLRERMNAKLLKDIKPGETRSFSDGVGYTIIGG